MSETIKLKCTKCPREFRYKLVQKFNSTIKPKPPREPVCNICKNKEILKEYNSTREKKQPISLSKKPVTKAKKNGAKKVRKKNVDKLLDSAWSKLVKLRGKRQCAVCGNRKSLNSHHVYSRANHSVRWDVVNGICLCVNHHIGVKFSAHKTPVDFTLWLIEQKGQAWIEKLRIKSKCTSKFHEFEKEIMLEELYREIKRLS